MKSKLVYLIFIFIINFVSTEIIPCALRQYEDGFVCVCNSTYCDKADIEMPEDNSVLIVSSSEAGLRFKVTYFDYDSKINIMNEPEGKIDVSKVNKFQFGLNYDTYISITNGLDKMIFKPILENAKDEAKNELIINAKKKYQEIIGFGGAYTGTVTYNVEKMSEPLSNLFYKAYYTRTDGIGYSMMRIPIGGCDFDVEQWAYNEYPLDDINLTNMTKLHKRDVPRIRQLKKLMEVTNNYDIKLLGLLWSPPRWMKTEYRWAQQTILKPEYYQTLADYHIKYLDLMSEHNISYWSLSTGNEPFFGYTGLIEFMNLAWSPKNLAKYMVENFAPTVRNSKYKNLKLLIGEDQRMFTPIIFYKMLEADVKSLDDIDGIAVTWYSDTEVPATFLDETLNLLPNKFIINTESTEPRHYNGEDHPLLGSWFRGEDYVLGLIEDFSYNVSGWIDWNLTLDIRGKPRIHLNLSCDAGIIVNETGYNEFYKQPMYFAMGHFSKFVTPGSVRIYSLYSGSTYVKTVAFLRPDNYIVVILLNIVSRPVNVTLDYTRGKKN